MACGAAAAIIAALAWNAGTLVRLHPYQYLYYNPLVGGLEGAAGRYDTDYWVNIMPEAVDELEAYVVELDATDPGRSLHRRGLRRAAAVREGSRLRACNGPTTGTRPTSSSRRRT